MYARYSVGHLNCFSEESALATFKDTGHDIVECFFTNGAFGLFKQHPDATRFLPIVSVKVGIELLSIWCFFIVSALKLTILYHI